MISCPRGKVLGGSSSINGMVYVRGHSKDFDGWQELGADGWGYANVLPYFKRAENWNAGRGGEEGEGGISELESYYRGKDGPLHVKNGDNAASTPLFEAFIKAGGEAGYGIARDYNSQRQEGFGPMAMTIFHDGPLKGMRCSTSSAYLHPALQQYGDKITVNTGVLAKRILFDNVATSSTSMEKKARAVGVEYNDASGNTHQIMAEKEVIACTGSIQTPQLLQVSGIGDEEHLQSIGVETIFHNEHVGQNLQDHLELYFQQEVIPPISIAPVMSSRFQQLKLGLQWILTRTGLGATNHFESAAFVRSSSDKTYPDIQFHFLPVGVSYDGVTLAKSKSEHSMQIHIGTCRSKSRGYVKATSSNMVDPPKIQFNYMSNEEDWQDMKRGIEVARQTMRQPAMKDIAGEEIMPGKDADLDEYIRQHVESAYHPCGTCRMGRSPNENDKAVVDNEGRVFGVDGLRVADASVFPSITNGNLNAPVIMVAEKMADHILGRDPLPPVEFGKGCEPWSPPSLEVDREKEPLNP